MAPKQDSEQLLVGEEGHDASDVEALDTEVDGAHVVVIGTSITPHHAISGKGKQKKKSGGPGGKLGQSGPEMPKNCPHLETALFFFGIAGMVISLIMLLLHFLRKIIPYY